jgi:hypothetical protein
MGMGATDTCGRVLASLGVAVAVKPEFEAAADVPNAGVLSALPALLSCGLLRGSDKHFVLPAGYYALPSIFLVLAFLAPARARHPGTGERAGSSARPSLPPRLRPRGLQPGAVRQDA